MRLLLDNTRRPSGLLPHEPHLFDNTHLQQLQPILVMCLTNHALDQFLQALMDAGINGIVRVGGRCIAFQHRLMAPFLQSSNCIPHA